MEPIIIISTISSNKSGEFFFFHVDFTELCSCFEDDSEKLTYLFAWGVKTDISCARKYQYENLGDSSHSLQQ